MDLCVMAVTQLSLFTEEILPTVLLFTVRKRIYEELPIIQAAVPLDSLYGEIQMESLEYSPSESTDEYIIEKCNLYMDELLNRGIDMERTFYSKRGEKFEILFPKKIVPIIESDMELCVTDSYPIKNTDNARIIKCALKPIEQ